MLPACGMEAQQLPIVDARREELEEANHKRDGAAVSFEQALEAYIKLSTWARTMHQYPLFL